MCCAIVSTLAGEARRAKIPLLAPGRGMRVSMQKGEAPRMSCKRARFEPRKGGLTPERGTPGSVAETAISLNPVESEIVGRGRRCLSVELGSSSSGNRAWLHGVAC